MQTENYSTPTALRYVVNAVCIITAISALAFAYIVAFVTVKPLWLMLGFELVTFTACVLGILFGLNKFQNAQGLALGCVAACIFVGAVLNRVSTQGLLQTNDASGGIGLSWYLLTRLTAAGILGFFGAALVLSRDKRSLSFLLRAAAFGLPLVAACGGLFVMRGRVTTAVASMPGVVTALLVILGGLVAVILTSGAVHCLIRAFEFGRNQRTTG